MSRFIEKDDCYLDRKTGLEWKKNDCGKPMTWRTAMDRYLPETEIKGDWRLPTVTELITLIDFYTASPATDLPNIKSAEYWSANYIGTEPVAWCVSFYRGEVRLMFDDLFFNVRLVRDGVSKT